LAGDEASGLEPAALMHGIVGRRTDAVIAEVSKRSAITLAAWEGAAMTEDLLLLASMVKVVRGRR
jgi:hypothetical protein